MHWCIDETLAVLRILSFLPIVGWWIYSYYLRWKHRHDADKEHKCHEGTGTRH